MGELTPTHTCLPRRDTGAEVMFPPTHTPLLPLAVSKAAHRVMRVRELALLLKAATLSGDRSCASPEQHSRVGLVVGGVREGDLTQLLTGCITLGRMGPAPLLGSTVELAWLVWVLMSRPRACELES